MANSADETITLSSALLAPINSLFEAQVQSARSFLSFILQLGFKERVTQRDLDEEKERLEQQQSKLEDDDITEKEDIEKAIKNIENVRKLINFQKIIKEENVDEALKQLEEEETRLKNLGMLDNATVKSIENIREYITLKKDEKTPELEKKIQKKLDDLLIDLDMKEDVYTLRFQYLDGEGIEHTIVIPALALVPVRPLAIESATFDFFMTIESSDKNYETKQKSRAIRKSPWEFIEPKRIKGKIVDIESKETHKGIKIHVAVGSAPIPAGLNNLLTSLTQSGRIEH